MDNYLYSHKLAKEEIGVLLILDSSLENYYNS
jgi:hypothetical protein